MTCSGKEKEVEFEMIDVTMDCLVKLSTNYSNVTTAKNTIPQLPLLMCYCKNNIKTTEGRMGIKFNSDEI
jgi:hypothetical protein